MSEYGLAYRGKHITVLTKATADKEGVACIVKIDDLVAPPVKGSPFDSLSAAQTTGAAFGRALVDAQLDGDVMEHRSYFIRVSSVEQLDGAWIGGYQLHRNDNPMPFRRALCESFRGNTRAEAEEHAFDIACRVIDTDMAAGKL